MGTEAVARPWRLVERGFDPRTHRRVGAKEVWVKRHPERRSASTPLEIEDVDFGRYGGPYAETFWLEAEEALIPIPDATWADWDDWDRLVFVRTGKLFAATIDGAGLAERELFDFNPLKPIEMAPPGWARRW